MVVVSMGLLGLAGMSIRSLAANDSSGYRAAAAQQAQQMSDLIRTNRQGVIDQLYNVSFGTATVSDVRANADVTKWKTALNRIPSGDGSILFTPATGTVTVTVRWDDRRGNQSSSETATLQTYAYTFRL